MSRQIAGEIVENLSRIEIDTMIGSRYEGGEHAQPIEYPPKVKEQLIRTYEAIATPIASAASKMIKIKNVDLLDGSLAEDQTDGPNYITDHFIPENVVEETDFLGNPIDNESLLEFSKKVQEDVGDGRDQSIIPRYSRSANGDPTTFPPELDDPSLPTQMKGYRVIVKDPDIKGEDTHVSLSSLYEIRPNEDNKMKMDYRHQFVELPTISIQKDGLMVLKFARKSCVNLRYAIFSAEESDMKPEATPNEDFSDR